METKRCPRQQKTHHPCAVASVKGAERGWCFEVSLMQLQTFHNDKPQISEFLKFDAMCFGFGKANVSPKSFSSHESTDVSKGNCENMIQRTVMLKDKGFHTNPLPRKNLYVIEATLVLECSWRILNSQSYERFWTLHGSHVGIGWKHRSSATGPPQLASYNAKQIHLNHNVTTAKRKCGNTLRIFGCIDWLLVPKKHGGCFINHLLVKFCE